jgi:hypothetical protein
LSRSPRPSDRGPAERRWGALSAVRPRRVSDRLFGFVRAIVTFRPDHDGRLIVVGALAVYFLILIVGRAFFRVDIWPSLGVPTGPSLFFDTRNVTAALDCSRLGFDPLVENPCDPWDRPMNYPRLWLALRWLGLDRSHTDALAVTFIALFIASVLLLLGRITLGQGIVVAVALCSPAVMFAIERANMDIVVYSLLASAMLVWGSRMARSDILSPLIVFLAAAAKIYPAFGLVAYLFSNRRRAAVTALVLLIGFAVYAAATIEDIQAVARTAPQGQYYSFGARILPAAIYHLFVPDRWAGMLAKQLVAVVPVLVAAPVLWLWGRRRRPSPDPDQGGRPRLAFHIGTLLFLATFGIANNFDYRLVFLLLTFPQLFGWIAAGAEEPRAGLAGLTLVVVVGLLWIGALSEPLRLADELVTWAAAGLLAALMMASIPSIRELSFVPRRRRSTSAEG